MCLGSWSWLKWHMKRKKACKVIISWDRELYIIMKTVKMYNVDEKLGVDSLMWIFMTPFTPVTHHNSLKIPGGNTKAWLDHLNYLDTDLNGVFRSLVSTCIWCSLPSWWDRGSCRPSCTSRRELCPGLWQTELCYICGNLQRTQKEKRDVRAGSKQPAVTPDMAANQSEPLVVKSKESTLL